MTIQCVSWMPFVDSLDLQALGFERAIPRETGRPPYNPRGAVKNPC